MAKYKIASYTSSLPWTEMSLGMSLEMRLGMSLGNEAKYKVWQSHGKAWYCAGKTITGQWQSTHTHSHHHISTLPLCTINHHTLPSTPTTPHTHVHMATIVGTYCSKATLNQPPSTHLFVFCGLHPPLDPDGELVHTSLTAADGPISPGAVLQPILYRGQG